MTRLDLAVRAARRVRRSLARWRRDTDLGGDCAIASLLVAAAIDDVGSLRHHDLSGVEGTRELSYKPWSPHVWNVVDGVIVDVTATQFNDLDEYQPYVRGVLVSADPRIFHAQVTGAGADTLAYLEQVGWSWYDAEEDEHRRFERAIKSCRAVAPSPRAQAGARRNETTQQGGSASHA